MDTGPIWVDSKWVGFNFRGIYPGPSNLIIPFKNDYTVALAAELTGSDEAAGTGADHCDAAGSWGLGLGIGGVLHGG